MFTYKYAQPDEYHFSMDSILFAEWLADRQQNRIDLSSIAVLDLCAGCGVIGLELSWYLRDLRNIDFVEVQEVYAEFFKYNVHTVNRGELNLNWFQTNYDALLNPSWPKKYDLIISNPPYFYKEHGTLTSNAVKNRCSFFLDSSFENFISAIVNVLDEKGEAYILLRSLVQHGINQLAEIKQLLPAGFVAEVVHTIRGTDVVKISGC